MTPEEQSAFLNKALDRFADWVKFGDAKAAGVLALLALGLADLLSRAGRLTAAHNGDANWGDLATGAFWLAAVVAVATVVQVSRALFPQVEADEKSLAFFGHVAEESNGTAYASKVGELTTEQANTHLASQAVVLAQIAKAKFHRLRQAYWLVLAFLTFWAIARLALALV